MSVSRSFRGDEPIDDPAARNKRVKVWAHPATGWSLLIAWAVTAFLLDIYWFDLNERFWILTDGFLAIVRLGLAALAAYAISRCIRLRGRPATVALLVAVALVGFGEYQYGRDAGLKVRFRSLKPRYEAVIAAFADGRNPPREVHWRIDQDPPRRIAFPWPGGILDNWSGVVYDPTGMVASASAFKPDFSNFSDPTLGDVRKLFGGDLFRCLPLGGHWYFCSFT